MPSVEDLRRFVDLSPSDPFPRYGLAMQLRSDGRLEDAIAELAILVEKFPGYVPGHHQLGISLEQAGRIEEARAAYRAGIESAKRSGNRHAAEEMAAALQMLG